MVIILGIAVVGAFGLFMRGDSKNQTGEGGKKFPPAAQFELKDATGKKVRLSDFAGKVVVLHFWAAWCPPCVEETPVLIAAMKRYSGTDLQLVAVSTDETWKDAFEVWPRKLDDSNIHSLLDPKSETAGKYGSYEFPETYIIGRDQKILAKWVGPQDWNSPQVVSYLQAVLSKP
jgi:peroxiredoxin